MIRGSGQRELRVSRVGTQGQRPTGSQPTGDWESTGGERGSPGRRRRARQGWASDGAGKKNTRTDAAKSRVPKVRGGLTLPAAQSWHSCRTPPLVVVLCTCDADTAPKNSRLRRAERATKRRHRELCSGWFIRSGRKSKGTWASCQVFFSVTQVVLTLTRLQVQACLRGACSQQQRFVS